MRRQPLRGTGQHPIIAVRGQSRVNLFEVDQVLNGLVKLAAR
jgi:hypothetical protein